MEMGRVLSIGEEDWDVGLPNELDDHLIGQNFTRMSPSSTNFLRATVHIVRNVGVILKCFQSPVIHRQTLENIDMHFNQLEAAFPENCRIYIDQPLDARLLSPICYLLSTSIIFHRHNLSPLATPDARKSAIDSCVNTARKTVHLLRRVFSKSNKNEDDPYDVAGTATAMLCSHVWRCTLFLLFRRLYHEAQICIRYLKTVGDAREINIGLGRYLYLFLNVLQSYIARGEDWETSEPMLALVSGDVQGSTESSWVWEGSVTGRELNSEDVQEAMSGASLSRTGEEVNGFMLDDKDKRDWGGWDSIDASVRMLVERAERENDGAMRGVVATGPALSSAPASSSAPSGASRISIANII